MAYKNLRHFIETLEQAGELVRIKTYVDPKLEIAEITDRISKSPDGGKALLFENTGTDFPVLINSMGSYRRMCLALGVRELDDIAGEIEALFKMLSKPKESILDKLSMLPKLGQFASWMPKVTGGKGACQEVVMTNPDLTKLPVLTCWPKDGGPFITLPVIHTKDPLTGTRNVGMYRMQVFEKDMTGMHWHKHKVSAKHFSEYKKLNKKMPVAVVLGGDPVYTYSATAPLPENVDEYMLAGFLRKKKVELVKCITQPEIEVPADADFVIEGYVDPVEDLIWEGPFGDHTGYYSLADWYPRFHVTAITHRKDAVYPSTIVGIPPQEDAWIGKATERIFLAPIKMTLVPEIVDMEMPVEGVFHNLVISQIRKDYPGQAQKVMNAMWGAGQMMFNKILVVTDDGVKINNYLQLAQYVFKNLNPATDIYLSQGPMDVLDHSCSKMGFGGKMCIDGTRKYEEELDTVFQSVPSPATLDTAAIMQQFPEIKGINARLLQQDISCILVAVEKNRPFHIRELNEQLYTLPAVAGVKMILYVEHTVDVNDLASALWRFCNNLDPKRDSFVVRQPTSEGKYLGGIGMDGTLKNKVLDNFERDWPNIIVAADDTIKKVDEKWSALGLGEFLPSPSLKYKHQIYGEEAVVQQ
ncbi:4-hydroxy-3-polyprenylbenzoate decarboxylase [Chitinophaga terrae (ex Kim and Jung 2007)]|uniref:4-hydroxy-3-polyprenylbenzoate decarboxylase n=1 Tax=Chitinophaga terrae (ex Kim and Jung 2007) TaxID=408074 RepID=A0A1H4ENS6_9BACT|nr:menaquinone biosynthesis decarboxylase [Chitinophaga terrae (ex Kim and Jung 2007)]GEP91773.1 menaquinone biosynthesis decarboxylase [Chitinophaga terrae (ex Kim and Jung 2007)]SEA86764.1 4-hydroxy-3-polyprenylbenzoate decarboxylase [Chitinophaga terrae (ex Kim and Jung 2007)]